MTILENGFFVDGNDFDKRFADVVQGWSFTSVGNMYGGTKWHRCPDSDRFRASDGYPRTLILSHLPLNRLHTLISSIRLLFSYFQLPLDFSSRFSGINGSMLGLVIQDARLYLHFLELAVENPSRIDAYSKQKNSDPNHVPIRVLEPWIGILWLCIGLALDFIAMWLLWIGSKASETTRSTDGHDKTGHVMIGKLYGRTTQAVPGALILKPDYPENMDDGPFLWGENEDVIGLAPSYIFLANAAQEALGR